MPEVYVLSQISLSKSLKETVSLSCLARNTAPALRSDLLPRFFAILIISSFLGAQTLHKASPHRLLVIAVDGLDSRFLTEPALRVKIPNIRKLMRQGAAATTVVGVTPSETWPAQASLVTGVPPLAEPATSLWEAASKTGLKTAAVYWQEGTSRRGEASFNFPGVRELRPDHDIPFDAVARGATPPGIVDRIEKASPGFQKELWDDASAARAAEFLLRFEKPELLLVQLTEVDSEQRETGALSVYARDALENDDELIGQILAAAPAGTIVALVSGHGLENQDYIVRPRVLLRQGKPVSTPVSVDVEYGLIGTSDPSVADRLRKLMADGHRHGIAREVPIAEVKERAPALARWVAAFDTPPNYVASAQDRGPALGPGTHLGVSGFWPTRPGCRSIFVVAGEGIAARQLHEIDLLQIAPTLADIIGVSLPQAKKPSLWPTISR